MMTRGKRIEEVRPPRGCRASFYEPKLERNELRLSCWAKTAEPSSFQFHFGSLLSPQLSAVALTIIEKKEAELRQANASQLLTQQWTGYKDLREKRKSAGIPMDEVPVAITSLLLICNDTDSEGSNAEKEEEEQQLDASLTFPLFKNLSSVSAPSRSVLDSVTSVYISNCGLSRFSTHPTVFGSTPQLEDLVLYETVMSEDDLSHLSWARNPHLKHLKMVGTAGLRRIKTGTFLSSNISSRLEKLDLLSNDNLELIETEAFVGLHRLSRLTLKYHHSLSTVQQGAFDHLPALNDLGLLDSPALKILFNDDESGQNPNAKVPLLSSSSSWYLPKVKYLGLNCNGIERISREIFKELASLEELNLSYNHLKDLASFEFVGKGGGGEKLKSINLSNNQIEGSIPETLFSSLPLLQHLDLSGNRLIGPLCLWTTFPPSLVSLHLEDNQITELLPRTPWQPLTNEVDPEGFKEETEGQEEYELKTLRMDNNTLSFLGPDLFPRARLEIFSVDNNEIREVLPWTFFGADNLQYVSLANNQLARLDPLALAVTKGLTKLNVQWSVRWPNFRLGGNHLECDCDLVWLAEELGRRRGKFRHQSSQSYLSWPVPTSLYGGSSSSSTETILRSYEYPDFEPKENICCRLRQRHDGDDATDGTTTTPGIRSNCWLVPPLPDYAHGDRSKIPLPWLEAGAGGGGWKVEVKAVDSFPTDKFICSPHTTNQGGKGMRIHPLAPFAWAASLVLTYGKM